MESVENIMRLDWKQVHAAETAVSGRYITSIACLDERTDTNELAMVLTLIESCMTSRRPTTICTPRIYQTTKFHQAALWRLWRKIPKSRAPCWRRDYRLWRSGAAAYHR